MTKNIISEMKSAGLFEPEFRKNVFFTVTLFRPIQFSKWINILKIKMSINQENILSSISNNYKITYVELSKKTGISQAAIIKNMKKLKELNLIELIGNKTKEFWQINTRI